MRIIFSFIASLIIFSCNNSSKTKEDIKDTAEKAIQMPQQPASPDTIFYGSGTEPFWSVYVIKGRKIVFHPAEGADVEVPWVNAFLSLDTWTREYNSSGNGNSIALKIMKKDCSDGMSERVHAYEVLLTVNQKKYTGCGNDKPASMGNEE
ncbi:MAG: hypothetical protein HOP10_11425 [Chitinophagaceae bacterium]|nr:hypothetical protein [Chitinophagaceae bacterium]